MYAAPDLPRVRMSGKSAVPYRELASSARHHQGQDINFHAYLCLHATLELMFVCIRYPPIVRQFKVTSTLLSATSTRRWSLDYGLSTSKASSHKSL
jgi:hypothetical protein